jgi:acetylornithine deacetylase
VNVVIIIATSTAIASENIMPISSTPLLDRIRQLIAIPSVSSVSPQFDQSNRPVVDLLANWLEDAGFAVRIEPLPEQPDKANLIATLGAGPGGLVLAGHTDTVPFDAGRWRYDPFGGVDGGRSGFTVWARPT